MDFKVLPRDIRTVALVGSFLQQWAMMESAINTAIAKALNLDDLQGLIVAKNVQFRDKIHILRTALSLTFLGAGERERFDKMLTTIGSSSHVRNMMAHDLFGKSDKTDGVEFLVVKAKGKLNFPEEDWPISKFDEWLTQMRGWALEIDKLAKKPIPLTMNAYVAALLQAAPPPNQEPGGLGILGHWGVPQPQGTPDANLLAATPEIDGESPPALEEPVAKEQ